MKIINIFSDQHILEYFYEKDIILKYKIYFILPSFHLSEHEPGISEFYECHEGLCLFFTSMC